jgi:serine/threonine protein phosphatase 1
MSDVWVIGDIHGCMKTFDYILNVIEKKSLDYKIITLGDYVDRGPDSFGVLSRLMELSNTLKDRFIPLQGNHESVMKRISQDGIFKWWISGFGGEATIESFRKNGYPAIDSIAESPQFKFLNKHL